MAELSGTAIAVSCVYPGGVKTNVARNSRYVTDTEAAGFERRARTTPEQAARRIIRGVKHGQQRIIVGADARIPILLMVWLVPAQAWPSSRVMAPKWALIELPPTN